MYGGNRGKHSIEKQGAIHRNALFDRLDRKKLAVTVLSVSWRETDELQVWCESDIFPACLDVALVTSDRCYRIAQWRTG
jgi:hypothetical protein